MAGINEVRLGGRVARDPVRYGNGPYRFSIAFGGGKKRGSDEQSPVEYFDCCYWGNTAAELKKGQEVLITGKLQQRRWETEGQNRSRVEIVVFEISDVPEAPKPLRPLFPIEPRLRQERKVAASRPITKQDPIADEDIPF